MTSSQRSRAKVLRVALIGDEIVNDELHQMRPGRVHVGTSIENNLLVMGREVPIRHPLFDYKHGRYFLDLPPGVRGKVALSKGRTARVSQLRKGFGKKDNLRVELSTASKGKLLVGDSILLFQFVDPAPVKPKPPFPVEFKPSLRTLMSRAEATIMGIFLAAAVGTVGYLETQPIDRDPHLEDIDERFIEAMGIVREEKPEDEEVVEEDAEEEVLKQEEEEEEKEVEEEKDPEPTKEPPKEISEKTMEEARSVGLARVLGTYGGEGPGTVFDIIQSTDNQLGDLFAKGMTGTENVAGAEGIGFDANAEGIKRTGGLMDTKGVDTGDAPEVGLKKKEKKIRGKLKSSTSDVIGDVSKTAISRTIKRRLSALQRCYEKALAGNKNLGGKVTYTIFISTIGRVTKVVVENDSLKSSAVLECTKSRIKGWRFPTEGAEDTTEATFSVVFSGA